MQAFVNDQFIAVEDARLHVSDLAIQRGYGVFDFFRIYRRKPLYLDDYLDRFYNSAQVMGLECPMPRMKLSNTVLELTDRNNMDHAGMKMILTGGYSGDGYTPSSANLVITQHPLVLPSAEQQDAGIKIITHEYRRDLPLAKTINYTMGIWLQRQVKEHRAVDVLYHMHGEVSEFPRCNFFMVTRDNVLVTPHRHILHGVTRKKILNMAPSLVKVEERSVTPGELKTAKELFLSSTTKRILPIVQADDTRVGDGRPGIVTRTLLARLIESESAI